MPVVKNFKKSKEPFFSKKRNFVVYYNDDTVDKNIDKIMGENIFISGFFRYVLENEDIVDAIIKRIPYQKNYRKGEH